MLAVSMAFLGVISLALGRTHERVRVRAGCPVGTFVDTRIMEDAVLCVVAAVMALVVLVGFRLCGARFVLQLLQLLPPTRLFACAKIWALSGLVALL